MSSRGLNGEKENQITSVFSLGWNLKGSNVPHQHVCDRGQSERSHGRPGVGGKGVGGASPFDESVCISGPPPRRLQVAGGHGSVGWLGSGEDQDPGRWGRGGAAAALGTFQTHCNPDGILMDPCSAVLLERVGGGGWGGGVIIPATPAEADSQIRPLHPPVDVWSAPCGSSRD